jgi:phosphopantothenoylcysteine decarboxylase / phosphopantothenate---cysteine ligase
VATAGPTGEPGVTAGADPRLAGARVVLGVTGGIAAYKAVEVCRRLVDAGAHVAPVLTEGAEHFVGAVTFSALASEPVRTSLWDDAEPIPHTHLGQTADVVVVAPATARLLADLVAGRSADLLTATLLATRAPVVVCPAMHTEMWEHPAVQENLAVLARRGVTVVDPEPGRLAGGDVGMGRLADPARIVAVLADVLGRSARRSDLAGRHVLVTAGGTREAIDPVRFIGNRSSGRMGHALAQAAADRGAAVTLVTTVDRAAPAGAEVVRVESAEQMADAVLGRYPHVDVVVMAAAVADFRPKRVESSKIKKDGGPPEVVLEPTPDILAELGRTKRAQVLVGFAAETDDLLAHAAEKLARKRADLLVANDVSAADAGFEVATNRGYVLHADGRVDELALMDKSAFADAVLDRVVPLLAPVPPVTSPHDTTSPDNTDIAPA